MKRLVVFSTLLGLGACTGPATEQSEQLPTLSRDAQIQRFAALEYALEHNTRNQPTSWVVSPTVGGSIAPLETVLSSTDGWCRDYEEIIAAGPQRYRLVGIACRKPGPRWLVLDVRPFVERLARR